MKWFGFFVLFTWSCLQAALPPLAQNIAELRALLNDSRLYELLGSGEVIQEIVRIKGGYEVVAKHQILHVEVHYLPPKNVGPARFELEFLRAFPTGE